MVLLLLFIRRKEGIDSNEKMSFFRKMQKEKSASTKELEQVNEGGDTDNSQALGMFFFCLKSYGKCFLHANIEN